MCYVIYIYLISITLFIYTSYCYIIYSFLLNQQLFEKISFYYILFREIIEQMEKTDQQSQNQLLKLISSTTYQPNKYGTSTTINTSSTSIESIDDQYRKSAIKWLMQFDRKVAKDTNYLSVWYLQILIKNGLGVKQSNWQLIAASIILFASKMNEIYPPSVSSILKRCKGKYSNLTLETIIEMQGKMLNLLGFEVAIQSPFNIICQILLDKKKEIQQCEKLLKIIIYNKDINHNDSETIAYAIIYLISRNSIDSQIQGDYRQKVKVIAQKMYNYYKEVRKNYQCQKEKEKIYVETNQISYSSNKLMKSTKQNSVFDQYSSANIAYRKDDAINGLKNVQNNDLSQLQKSTSYKFIPKPIPFTQNNLNQSKDKRLLQCISRQDLKDSYKNVYFYS